MEDCCIESDGISMQITPAKSDTGRSPNEFVLENMLVHIDKC